MKQYNDYVALTRNHLMNMRFYKAYADNVNKDIADREKELATVSIKTSNYGPDPGGGGGGLLNGLEATADRRIMIENEIEKLRYSLIEVEALLRKLDAAIGLLDGETKEVIQAMYGSGMHMAKAIQVLNMSERSIRRLCSRATKQIACTLYGPRAQEHLYFIRII